MRLRPDFLLRAALALAIVILAARGISAQQTAAGGNNDIPSDAEISRAVEAVKTDPNLATERTIKMLRWKETTSQQPATMPAWLEWIGGLFRWVDQSARFFMWGAAIVLAGVLGAYLYRILRLWTPAPGESGFIAPTHVLDLDIRPESLPDHIGAAARQLWDRGEHRAALALLYRGLLSRLAHVHQVPIRDSSTEGDCLVLAAAHLSVARHEYASQLIMLWQRVVYGHEQAPATVVYALCDDFGSAMDPGSSEGAA